MGFFDGTLFAKTPERGDRLNERYLRIIAPNLKAISGKRILDLASHNGCWSYAALTNGAASVVGIEGRKGVMNSGLPIFSQFDESRYHFICGDVFAETERLIKSGSTFDTILCLGIFYHIMDHYRLMRLMVDLKPSCIILDTALILSDEQKIVLQFERTDRASTAIPETPDQAKRIVGCASISALDAMAKSCGYSVERIDWNLCEVQTPEAVMDYFKEGPEMRRRFTLVLRPSNEP